MSRCVNEDIRTFAARQSIFAFAAVESIRATAAKKWIILAVACKYNIARSRGGVNFFSTLGCRDCAAKWAVNLCNGFIGYFSRAFAVFNRNETAACAVDINCGICRANDRYIVFLAAVEVQNQIIAADWIACNGRAVYADHIAVSIAFDNVRAAVCSVNNKYVVARAANKCIIARAANKRICARAAFHVSTLFAGCNWVVSFAAVNRAGARQAVVTFAAFKITFRSQSNLISTRAARYAWQFININ